MSSSWQPAGVHPGGRGKVSPRRLLPVGVIAVASTLALGACGSSEPKSREDKVNDAIEEAFTSTDPDSCKLFTSNWFKQVSGGVSAAERRACATARENGASYASSIDASKVRVSGRRARAKVKIEGGELDAQGLTLGLVRRKGDWKIDGIKRVDVLDRDEFLESYLEPKRDDLERDGLTRRQADCILGELEKASDSELEEILVEHEPPVVVVAVLACV